jgi:hypothetical protein
MTWRQFLKLGGGKLEMVGSMQEDWLGKDDTEKDSAFLRLDPDSHPPRIATSGYSDIEAYERMIDVLTT